MKKLVLTSAAILLLSAVAAGQQAKPSGAQAKDYKKTTILTGTVSSDATILLADKDHRAWKVANPETLADHAGRHVRVTARIESPGKEIVIISAKTLEDEVLTAKRDDAAFRR